MGTHPIFESDFDCLTEKKAEIKVEPEMSQEQQKRPRSILKRSGEKSVAKDFQFDEQNVLETFHPEGKDYGHMKIDEAKTPYHDPTNPIQSEALSEADLMSRLEQSKPVTSRDMMDYNDSDSDSSLSPKEKKKKNDFKSKRSQHYNMKEAMRKAKQMIQDDE